MACNNCYNGCSETTSDRCVKYTGIDIPALGIETGDSLAAVESAIFTFLVPMLDGTGIRPIVDETYICDLISEYLPVCVECNGFTLNEILTAIIRAVCDLQGQIDNIVDDIEALESDYDVECITGVIASSGTHDILQAVITKLCEVDTSLAAVILDITTNYVSIDDVNDYIQAYINTLPITTLYNSRMVPYTASPYFGSLSNFDMTGAGTGAWINIYLCNGQNSTPDLRGRAIVGTTSMGSTPFSPVVDPAVSGNPTYALNTVAGINQITLGTGQIPAHTHVATSVVTDPGHIHNIPGGGAGDTYPTLNDGTGVGVDTASSETDITVETTLDSTGGGLPHPNIQPVHAAHWIIYLP